MKATTREFIRSVRGQLTLLAVVFAGAVALALTAVALRGVVFEPYVREWRKPTSTHDALTQALAERRAGAADVNQAVEQVAQALAAGRRQGPFVGQEKKDKAPPPTPREIERARTSVLDACYHAWLQSPPDQPRDPIVEMLAEHFREDAIFHFKRTLAVGNLSQRERVLHGVALLARVDQAAARELLDLAERRAERRGERDLAAKADALRQRLE